VAVDLLIGAAVTAGVVYVWGWRRFRYLRAHWQQQNAIGKVEALLREAREVPADSPYRMATAADGELVEPLDAARADADALVACGFTRLGDVLSQRPERPVTGRLRAFVDAEGTTCATLAATPTPTPTVRLRLLSFAGDDVFATRRGSWPSLTEPPSVHVQWTAAELPIAAVVEQHRAFARGDVSLRSCDELIAALGHAHAHEVRWRQAQPSDALLDSDLRGVLGAHYDRLGKAWARRMRSPLPEATARRR
jgi:hypothetical protein